MERDQGSALHADGVMIKEDIQSFWSKCHDVLE